ncbi:MAG: hypothetical protein J1E07_10790, partial [Treponema sp.]|nr:hypothetical protein [Treponema sp.]
DNSADVAKLLIDAGANVNAKDDYNQTALMIATDNVATDVAELLKAAGAR